MDSLVFCENTGKLYLSSDPSSLPCCGNHENCRHAVIKPDKVIVGIHKLPEVGTVEPMAQSDNSLPIETEVSA